MKISVSTYSFNKLLVEGKLNQFETIAIAKEMGFDGIEFVDIKPHDSSTREDYAKKLADEAKNCGLVVTSYTFGGDLINNDLSEEVKRIKGEIDLAVILGATRVRHDCVYSFPKEVRGFRGFDDMLPLLADGCRQITEYAATKGIKTMVENHGQFAQDSDRVEKLINTVAHPNFGLLADMGNFLCVDEDPTFALGRLAPYVFYAHAKDFYFKSGMEPDPGKGFFTTRGGNYLKGAIVGHGVVPVKQCLDILKRGGYDDFVAIEFEGMEDAMIALPIGLENLRNYIG